MISKKRTSRHSKQHLAVASSLQLQAQAISVRRAGHDVLRNVTFCVHAGEFIGLIGPNGAGKSSLLLALLDLLPLSSGSVRRLGATIGYVPQHSASYQTNIPMSAWEVVRLGSAGKRSPALEALKLVGMMEHQATPITELSGGQLQRVVIAKALAAQPDVLLLDEPTTGIDEAARHTFYSFLGTLHKKGISIVLSSHELEAVLATVTRLVCLDGVITYDGPPEHFEADSNLPQLHADHHRLLRHGHGVSG